MKKKLKRWAIIFTFLALVANIISFFLVFYSAPTEVTMGEIQKIFYYHVPFAIVCYFLLFISFVFSWLFLLRRKFHYDFWAHSGAEVGMIFIVCVLVSGTIWGRAAWGKWWVWEPRLSTFLIMFVIYFSYFLFRTFGREEPKTPKIAAVFSILGFIDVPIVNRAIVWWGSIVHPTKVSLEPEMKLVFLFSFFSVLVLALSLLLWRVYIEERIVSNDD